jgi:protein farnesyltransferase/geranylgeranyltransferase type-1 subunit alpha
LFLFIYRLIDRRNIVELLKDPSAELEFTKKIIRKDSKNYHAWQYRQWVIKAFNLWSSELNYVNELLKEDVRNNSAWNQRYFYLKNNYDLSKSESIDILNEEIEFSLEKIDHCIDNESSWNYLRAIVNHLIDIYSLERKKLDLNNNYLTKVNEFCDKKFQSNTEDDRSPFLLSYIVEMNMVKVEELIAYLEELDDENNKEEQNKVLNELKKLVNSSIEILDLLSTKFDTIRASYWNYQVSKWKSNYSKYI